MSLDEKFTAAVEIVQKLPKDGPLTTSNSQKLTFYSLYKQATVGDINTERPGMLAFTEKAKWDAWNGVKGMSAEEAKQKYVDEINQVFNTAAEEIDIENWLSQIDPSIGTNLAILGKK